MTNAHGERPRTTIPQLGFLLLATLIALPTHAITVTNTNDSGEGSLRWAVANAGYGGTVDFAPSLSGGTIRLETEIPINFTAIRIHGPGSENLTISGEKRCRIFSADVYSSLTLTGMTIQNGVAVDKGGGIYCRADLAMRDCVVRNCSVDPRLGTRTETAQGGGIYKESSADLAIVDCAITSNMLVSNYGAGSSGNYGVGLSIMGTPDLKLLNTQFTKNVSLHLGTDEVSGGSYGIGASLSGHGVIDNCAFSDNFDARPNGSTGGADGAGLDIDYIGPSTHVEKSLVVRNCRFERNRIERPSATFGSESVLRVGGIESPLRIENCLIADNQLRPILHNHGGMSYESDVYPAIQLRNLTITRNTCQAPGLWLSFDPYNYGGEYWLTMTHCTIVGNNFTKPEEIPGLNLRGSVWSARRTTLVQATVISGNRPLNDGPELAGNFHSDGYNVVDSVDGDTADNALDGPGDMVGADPMLGELADNGGPTMTMMPLAGSPLVDAIPAAQSFLGFDQRGLPRPAGAGSDIGACETAAASAPSGTGFARVQNVTISADEHYWVGIWSFEAGDWAKSIEGTGSRLLTYYLSPDEVASLLLYNFDAAAYTDGMQVWHQTWN